MSDKLPQPAMVLVVRLQRVGFALDKEAEAASELGSAEALRAALAAKSNTCWQAARRLMDYVEKYGELSDPSVEP